MTTASARRHRAHTSLLERARAFAPIPMAVCMPTNEVALGGALAGAAAGLCAPVLVGPPGEIRAAAERGGFAIDGCEIVATADEREAAARSVELCRNGRARAMMKGAIHSDVLLHAVLDKATGLRGPGRMTHVFVLDAPAYDRLILLTDAVVNVFPDLTTRIAIVRNAIRLAHDLGIAHPNVALLSAVELVGEPFSSTLDDAVLCKMADRGQITGGTIDGPMAFDAAVSAEAARIKGLQTPMAGAADIFVAPNLEAGNLLSKALVLLAGAETAGIVLGARVPIVLTSRSDSAEARTASCALAVLVAEGEPDASP